MDQISKPRDWRGVSILERQHYMANSMHVNHPDFVLAANEIRRRSLRCENENTGAGILVLAPSGAGKTHLCRFLKSRWPDEIGDAITRVPVVKFDIPPSPSDRSMGRAMLAAMGDPTWNIGTAIELDSRIRTLLPKIGTKVILVDNVHDVPDRRGARGIQLIGNWIRNLIEASKRTVVLLGTSAATPIVYSNSQLRRRTVKQLHIDYFYTNTERHLALFARFLRHLYASLPLADRPSDLDESLVREIHYATFGIPDYIFQLFIEAVAVALAAGREHLCQEDFATAFPLIHKDSLALGLNPFLPTGPKRPLTQEYEPFFNWFDASNPPLRSPRGVHP